MKYRLLPGKIEIDINEDFNEKTLESFLEYFHQSKKNRYLAILNKEITINREVVNDTKNLLHKGDTVAILLPKGEVDYQPADEECIVVYEDDFVYIAHKDAGVLVHDPNDNTCLAAQAARYQINHGIEAPVRFIHRLDVETTGLVLFVKHPFFLPFFDAMLENKEIRRSYLAITCGRGAAGQKFTYRQKIGKDRHINGKYRFSETGKDACTKVEFLKKKDGYLLIRCTLETGRTHQIRVHLSGNRQPIVNDPVYGISSADFNHMGLWADHIEFMNPVTGEICSANDIDNPDYKFFG